MIIPLILAGSISQSWGLNVSVCSHQVEITPPEPLPLGGYTARGDHTFEPGGEPLFARSLILKAGDHQIAIVSFDSLTVPESLATAVQEKVGNETKVILVATHTHSAPDSQMFNKKMSFRVPGIAPYNRKWTEWMIEKLASTITGCEGSDSQRISETNFYQTEVDANRGRREGAQPSKKLTRIEFGNSALMNYAAHAIFHDSDYRKTSGDFPGDLVKISPNTLFLPGALGDVSPKADGNNAKEKITNMVNKLMTWKSVKPEKHKLNLAYWEESINISQPIPHPEFATSMGVSEGLATIFVNQTAPREATLRCLRLDHETVLVFVPAEPAADVGRRIEIAGTSLGFRNTIVVSHAHGWLGYVLSPEEYDKGGYEATLSFHGKYTSKRILEAAIHCFEKLTVHSN